MPPKVASAKAKSRRQAPQPQAKAKTGDKVKVLGGNLEVVLYDLLPLHDSTWGICTGVDGNIYIGACGECIGGLSVFILRYDPDTEELEYLIEVGPEIGEPPDNGRATQSKIHYCMIPGSDGLIYCATHASGPPAGHPVWRPWNCWDDERIRFPGAHLFTFDPKTNSIHDYGVGPKREGSRCMAMDEKRRKLYGITWPRNHVYVYYLDEKRYLDLGRIGEINPQAIFLDKHGNAYTTDDYGYIIRCDADTNEMKRLNVKCPHLPYRIGWHNVPYDVVPSPDGETFFGIDWGFENHVWEFDPRGEGSMRSFGRVWGPPEWNNDHSLEYYQLRALVFGADGKLYFTGRVGWEKDQVQHLVRLDTVSGTLEDVGAMDFPGRRGFHAASATFDFYGNLYVAEAGLHPTGMYIYRPDFVSKKKNLFSWEDVKPWG